MSLSYRLFIFAIITISVLSLSPMVVLPSALKYQTGRVAVITTMPNRVSNTLTYLPLPFVNAAPTTSLNGSLGVVSNHWNMKLSTFGWKVAINSISATSMEVSVVTNSNQISVSLLELCYLVSW